MFSDNYGAPRDMGLNQEDMDKLVSVRSTPGEVFRIKDPVFVPKPSLSEDEKLIWFMSQFVNIIVQDFADSESMSEHEEGFVYRAFYKSVREILGSPLVCKVPSLSSEVSAFRE